MANIERFFIDRSLGALIVPQALRQAGWLLTTMDERYGREVGEGYADVDWIREATALGEVCLTKDVAIARRPSEAQSVYMNDARVFAFNDGHITGPQMADRLLLHEHTILRIAGRQHGPYVYSVQSDRVRRLKLSYP
ncbi:MAG TPA: hypothetical protein VIJ18_18060 [Microbacteriaceae bacterium]